MSNSLTQFIIDLKHSLLTHAKEIYVEKLDRHNAYKLNILSAKNLINQSMNEENIESFTVMLKEVLENFQFDSEISFVESEKIYQTTQENNMYHVSMDNLTLGILTPLITTISPAAMSKVLYVWGIIEKYEYDTQVMWLLKDFNEGESLAKNSHIVQLLASHLNHPSHKNHVLELLGYKFTDLNCARQCGCTAPEVIYVMDKSGFAVWFYLKELCKLSGFSDFITPYYEELIKALYPEEYERVQKNGSHLTRPLVFYFSLWHMLIKKPDTYLDFAQELLGNKMDALTHSLTHFKIEKTEVFKNKEGAVITLENTSHYPDDFFIEYMSEFDNYYTENSHYDEFLMRSADFENFAQKFEQHYRLKKELVVKEKLVKSTKL